MGEFINQLEICKRLIDYVVVVGVRNPTLSLTETPETLRKFPKDDYEDFYFPPDVVFFCQPEGCCTVTKKISLRQATSFIFTLTDKESGKTRYGISMNFYRPCLGYASKDDRESETTKGGKPRNLTRCMSLTSLCLLSHHAFFSSFRESLYVLRRMIESRGGSCCKQTNQPLDCWSLFLCNEDPKLSPLQDDMREIESWIQRLLVTPVPIPGRTEVELELLPQELHPAISFAFPDAKRFSLIDFPIHLPLELLGVEIFLKVLTCILLEQKVVFQSRDYNALTMTILAMSSLLYPLEYMFPIIPLLPCCMNNAEQLLLAPTPYIIGVPASFFKYKDQEFNNPHDLWIIDLDSNKVTVPFQADELPELPEPEVNILKGNLKRALASLSVPPQTIPTLDGNFSLAEGMKDTDIKVPLGLSSNQIVYGNDVDTVDVSVRVAMTSFFLAQNVLGSLYEHTRTLRLFPRPVVAVQKDAFLQSLPNVSKFVLALMETQTVEYFAEWLVYPNNIVYTRIQMGITDPHLVGDKPRWYNYKLDKLNFKAFDPDSKISNEKWSVYEAELFGDIYESDEGERQKSIEDDDSSSCYSSVSDTVAEMFRGDIHGETPGSHLPPFTPPHTSSPTPNCMANLHNPYWLNDETFPDALKAKVLETDSYSLEDEDDTDNVHSVSNPPSPSLDNQRTFSIASTLSDPVAKSDVTIQTSSEGNGMGRSDAFQNVDSVKTHLSKANSATKSQNSLSMDTKLASLQANALFKPFGKERKPIPSEDQLFLHEIVSSVLNANGVGMFKKKRLRELMTNESCRQKVVNKLLLEVSDDKKADVVPDVNVSKAVLRGMLDILRSAVLGMEESVQNFGLGRVTSSYHFLRIAHTHYYGREIKDIERNNEESSGISPTGSISNLSDNSDTTVSTVSMNESGDRSTLVNSDSDLDSGHCEEASEVNSEIDSVMVPLFPSLPVNNNNRHVNLVRTRSDACIVRASSELTVEERSKLARTMSNSDMKLAVTNGHQDPHGSPRLAHMKMTSYRKVEQLLNPSQLMPNVRFLTRKSDLSTGNRYYSRELIDVDDGSFTRPDRITGRKYLFQGLLGERSTLWDNMDFWEYLFMDVVAAERDALGMNQNFGEMIERYRSLGKLEQKRLEEDEDKVLGTVLFNLTAFMIQVNVDKKEIKRKIRRIIGKAHVGLCQSQCVGHLLASIENLHGNDIDLRPDRSRQMTKKTFVVHCGSNLIGDVYFMEVCDDCILLRAPSGTILERWWYEKLVNITYSPKTKMLCLWYRNGQDTQLNKFCTKKCKSLYFCIKGTMQRAAERLQGLKGGPQLGGKFPAQDVDDGQIGILEVSLDGITVKFKHKKTHLHLNCIKNCSTQKGILVIDEFDPVTQEEIQHRFKSSMASDICYAVLCLFSYAAASKGVQVRS